ncbi:MAG: hypothetical protein EAZ06_06830 [Cytophagales bacterium]|nr:MAG: hypothetical protein EAZ06_06830 [Cytophagales bacterium]
MKLNTEPLEAEKIYHIYNRGINGDNIFITRGDGKVFLDNFFSYTENILDTYCYCLLKNHFHFLVKIKSESEIREKFPYKLDKSISSIISKQFSHFFNSYANIFKNKYERTGGLFETPFRRIWVDSDAYFTEMIYYIHSNPQKHGFTGDFRNHLYSSYHIYENDLISDKVKVEEVLNWFGGKEEFKRYHEQRQKDMNIQSKYIFEVD